MKFEILCRDTNRVIQRQSRYFLHVWTSVSCSVLSCIYHIICTQYLEQIENKYSRIFYMSFTPIDGILCISYDFLTTWKKEGHTARMSGWICVQSCKKLYNLTQCSITHQVDIFSILKSYLVPHTLSFCKIKSITFSVNNTSFCYIRCPSRYILHLDGY